MTNSSLTEIHWDEELVELFSNYTVSLFLPLNIFFEFIELEGVEQVELMYELLGEAFEEIVILDYTISLLKIERKYRSLNRDLLSMSRAVPHFGES